jgi:hypothetical protein
MGEGRGIAAGIVLNCPAFYYRDASPVQGVSAAWMILIAQRAIAAMPPPFRVDWRKGLDQSQPTTTAQIAPAGVENARNSLELECFRVYVTGPVA